MLGHEGLSQTAMMPTTSHTVACCVFLPCCCRFHPSAVRWCLTVPAGLSQSSMALMRKAAMAAGLVPSADCPALLLTSEPEAAALTAQQRRDLPGQPLVACTV